MLPLRYYPLRSFYETAFHVPVRKAVLDAGFTCPNLDGTLGTGGCIFCDGGSGQFTHKGTISQQLEQERLRIHHTQPDAKLIAYFQAHTNTYGSPTRLQRLYEEALAFSDVIGIAIGTRPDCLPEPVLTLLETLSQKTFLTVELGLQTIHDATAARIHRGYDYDTFLEAFHKLQQRNIRTCVHLINGLPGEIDADMIETARVLGKLRPNGVKIHLLHILKDTPLAKLWEQGKITALSQAEYVQITAAQLGFFPEETVIERLTGDGASTQLLAPLWGLDKTGTRNAILQHLKRTDNWQGKYFQSLFHI